MQVDRTIAPPIHLISKIELPTPERIVLSNGIPVYISNMGTQEVMKLQIAIKAGRPYEDTQMAARATGRMLREGTKRLNSAEIAEAFDFYGASLSLPTSLDYSSLVYYSMTKHFPKLISLVTELLTQPVFPEKELTTFKENSKRRLQIDLTKNDVVAYRKITELIFGDAHPYGYNSTAEKYDRIQRKDLVQHFQKNFHANHCVIFLSGKINESILQLIDQHLGQIPAGIVQTPFFPTPNTAPPQKSQFFLPNSLQKAIRIGKRSMTRNHPDYIGFMVVNTILGGYFGSRLMMNIREDKGYTYNIYSLQDTMQQDACFYISTEVGNEFLKPTLKEIYLELDRLQTDLVPTEELEMVKNYLLGNMLNMVDGPFKVTNVVKTFVLENRPFEGFQQMVDLIRSISAQEIRDLAQKYLKAADMWEVVV